MLVNSLSLSQRLLSHSLYAYHSTCVCQRDRDRPRARQRERLGEILKQKPAVHRFAPQLTDSLPSKVCIETRMLRLHSDAAMLIPRGTSYNLGLRHFAADDADESTNRATTTCYTCRRDEPVVRRTWGLTSSRTEIAEQYLFFFLHQPLSRPAVRAYELLRNSGRSTHELHEISVYPPNCQHVKFTAISGLRDRVDILVSRLMVAHNHAIPEHC